MGTSRTVAAMFTSAVVMGACSSADKHRASPTDGGAPEAAPVGSGGRVGTGGSGGRPASGGSVSTGGSAGVKLDASPDVSGDGGDGAPAPLVCPGPTGLDAGDAGNASLGEWRDWASHACAACPAAAPTCDDLGGPRLVFDRATKRVTIHVAPGVAEIVGGTLSLQWDGLRDDGGLVSGAATAPLVVSENTLVADLSTQIGGTAFAVFGLTITVNDACGLQSVADNFQYQSDFDDSGPTTNIYCEH